MKTQAAEIQIPQTPLATNSVYARRRKSRLEWLLSRAEQIRDTWVADNFPAHCDEAAIEVLMNKVRF